MILSEHDAKQMLATGDGQILMRVRAERDWLAEHLKVMTSSLRAEMSVDDMVRQESEWAGYSPLLDHFASNHRWTQCQQVEALKLLCNRAAELEREACANQQHPQELSGRDKV